MKIENLKKGDYVFVKCKVEAVFVDGGMVMVTTKDCDTGFDAYIDEIVEKKDKQGKWIKGKEISRTMLGSKIEHIKYEDYTCSNCGLVLNYLLYHVDGSPFYKFCPNCGAKMREEEEND